jgi:hypothetical protein
LDFGQTVAVTQIVFYGEDENGWNERFPSKIEIEDT